MNGLTPGNIDENNINALLACIAFQELSLSHLINAEGEKIQYAVGTLPDLTPPAGSIAELLEVNNSVQSVLNCTFLNELALLAQLQCLLNPPGITGATGTAGATGPTGPTGAAGGLASALSRTNTGPNTILLGGAITFATAGASTGTFITVVSNTTFGLTQPGLYKVSLVLSTALLTLLSTITPSFTGTATPSPGSYSFPAVLAGGEIVASLLFRVKVPGNLQFLVSGLTLSLAGGPVQ